MIFFRLGRQDMLSDDGHYAFRSLGYFDYLTSLRQTTPVQWFGERPAWSYLSFHDHPLIFFLTQHIFFKVFGDSVVVSRLPSALAGLGSLLVLFCLAKFLWGVNAALFSAAALVLNSYFIWNSRIGHLESLFLFFFLLGLLFLVKGLRIKPKCLLWAGFFFGVSLLTKYTLLLAIPGIFLYFVWKERKVFKTRNFWLGILIFLVVISPIIIYNCGMFQSRGHFDVQLSDLFQQKHNDWPLLHSRVSGLNFNFREVFSILGIGFSWPYMIVFIIALIFILLGKKFRDQESLIYLPIFVFFSLFLVFSYIGGADRWLAVLAPFAAVVIGLALFRIQDKISGKIVKAIFFGTIFLLTGFLLFYTLNTNHLHRAVGGRFWYANSRLENLGYNQLDKKIKSWLVGKDVSPNLREIVRLLWYSDFKPKTFEKLRPKSTNQFYDSLIIYDSDTNWFPTVWIFERWKLYHQVFIMSSYEFLKIAKKPENVEILNLLGFQKIYYIHAGPAVKKQAGTNYQESQVLLESYQKQKLEPEIIYDDKGREAFYIYSSPSLSL